MNVSDWLLQGFGRAQNTYVCTVCVCCECSVEHRVLIQTLLYAYTLYESCLPGQFSLFEAQLHWATCSLVAAVILFLCACMLIMSLRL